IRREDICDHLCERRSLLVLLVAYPLPHSLSVRLVAGAAGLLGAVPLSDEHGKGAAFRNHLFDRCDLLVLPQKILATLAVELGFRTDLRHVCVADSRHAALDGGNWLDGTAAGMAAV